MRLSPAPTALDEIYFSLKVAKELFIKSKFEKLFQFLSRQHKK